MKFQLNATSLDNSADSRDFIDQVFKKYPKLKDCHVVPEQGNCGYWYIEVASLDHLLSILNAIGSHAGIILFQNDDNTLRLEIYDDYRE